MKVFALAPKESWIIDRICNEFKKTVPEFITENVMEADVLWLAAGWCWNHIHPQILSQKKVVLTEHHMVPEKITKQKVEQFLMRDRIVDVYHVPNEKTKIQVSKLTKKPIKVLGYWYDEKIWKSREKEECRKFLSLDDKKFIIGSFQRDTEGTDLISPKLEKGPDIFCDYVEKVSQEKDVHVLLGGWRRQYVISRLENAGISYTYRELSPLKELSYMYGACDLYVVGSRFEGGPQSILECAAMKVPIVSNDVGMARDVLTDSCVIDVKNDVYYPSEDDVLQNYENVKNFELKSHVEKYLELFREVERRVV